MGRPRGVGSEGASGPRSCAPGVRAGSPRLAHGGRSSDSPALSLRGAGPRSALAGPPRRALCRHAVRRAGDAALLCQPSRYPSWRSAGTEGKGRTLSPRRPEGAAVSQQRVSPQPGATSTAGRSPGRACASAPSAKRSGGPTARRAPINPRAAPPAGGAGSACAFAAPERRAQARAPPGDQRGAWSRPARGRKGRSRARRGRGPRRGGAGSLAARSAVLRGPAGWVCALPSLPTSARAAGPARSVLAVEGAAQSWRRAAAGRWAWCGGARSGGGPVGLGTRLPQVARAGGTAAACPLLVGPGPECSVGSALSAAGGTLGCWAGPCTAFTCRLRPLPPQSVSVRMRRAFGWSISHPNTHTRGVGAEGGTGGHPGVRGGRTYRPCPLEELRQTGGGRWIRGEPPRR